MVKDLKGDINGFFKLYGKVEEIVTCGFNACL
jgi:hypothetical protein